MIQKIGIKEGHRVALIGAPRDWTIDELPASARLTRRRGVSNVDVAIAFFRDQSSLRDEIVPLSKMITVDGALWIAWPRRSGGHTSDLTDNVVRYVVLPLGLVDVKVAALDDDWSALKMMWRKELRVALR